MSKPKHAATAPAAPEPVNWTGARTQRVEYEPAATIFAQGDPATSVMYVAHGAVRLSVLSHTGKEAVVAVLDVAHFFGEGCLAGQSQRMATATAMTACTIVVVEKQDMVRQLHANPAFADRFLSHMLTRNIRIEEDLVDQLFNSSEKRLRARCCCSRVTVSQTRLIGHCRDCPRRHLPRWWERRARV
jgi:CRP-like cAMP-binding protein